MDASADPRFRRSWLQTIAGPGFTGRRSKFLIGRRAASRGHPWQNLLKITLTYVDRGNLPVSMPMPGYTVPLGEGV